MVLVYTYIPVYYSLPLHMIWFLYSKYIKASVHVLRLYVGLVVQTATSV